MTHCHFGVKQGRTKLKFGMVTNLRSKRRNMTSIFQNDNVFIKYSYKVTHCHFGVKQGQTKLKFGVMTNFWLRN